MKRHRLRDWLFGKKRAPGTGQLPLRPTTEEVRGLILADHANTRALYVGAFEPEIASLSDALTRAFLVNRAIDDLVRDARTGHIAAFYLYALNSLVSSSQLLVSGMLVPSGNMMRQYGESLATAMLFCFQFDFYERYTRNPQQFSVKDSIKHVGKFMARRSSSANRTAWKTFARITKFYDQFSHASARAVASQLIFASRGRLVTIGGGFDPAKLHQYRIEFVRRRSAADVLVPIGVGIAKELASWKHPQPPAKPTT